jgi:2-C-methyl-D-erythritol 4-phosphate cytidylyltransferase
LEKIVLIVAGGQGMRMNAGVPKQLLAVAGYPVLMHTIWAFVTYDPQIRIRVALPPSYLDEWRDLCKKYNFSVQHDIAAGGETRFHTIQKNIGDFPDDSLVAVHDGVRPLVSLETINNCFKTAEELGNAVPCIKIPESMRKITHKGNIQVSRNAYRLIQTPQVFLASILKMAYKQEYQKSFTDDAGVVGRLGYRIHLVNGNVENIKLTYPVDLVFAAVLLEKNKIA